MNASIQPPLVAVVMLTVNQRETTLRALGSLAADERAGMRILVWDNASTDGTIDAIRTRFPDVHTHRSETNLGVAGGRNAAAALARQSFHPTHLLFLDNDLVLTPGFAAALLEAFADPLVGQAQGKLRFLATPDVLNDGGGCRIRFWSGRTEPVGKYEVDRGQYDAPAPCVACGGAMMVRADLFQELGGFDLLFNPFGPEDLDFSLRLQQRGYKAMYIPRAMAYHEVSHTFGSGYSAHYARIKSQHWLRFLRRHGSPGQQLAFALAGAPIMFVRMAVRELRNGNPGAILGSIRGVVAAFRRPSTRTGHADRPNACC